MMAEFLSYNYTCLECLSLFGDAKAICNVCMTSGKCAPAQLKRLRNRDVPHYVILILRMLRRHVALQELFASAQEVSSAVL